MQAHSTHALCVLMLMPKLCKPSRCRHMHLQAQAHIRRLHILHMRPVCPCSCPSLQGCCQPSHIANTVQVLFKMDKSGEGQEVAAADLALNRDPSFIGFTHQMFLEVPTSHACCLVLHSCLLSCHGAMPAVQTPCSASQGGYLCSCGRCVVRCCCMNVVHAPHGDKDDISSVAILTCSAYLGHRPVVPMSSSGVVHDNVSCSIAIGTTDGHK